MKKDNAIEINNLSKKYYRGAIREWSLRGGRGRIKEMLIPGNLFLKNKKEAFWALRNIDLTVQKGEILGIIGNNGSGKSTLLKILAGITPPTEGRIEINGRIAPMLELGAGFHGDLTGRDNVFLNGAIIGMNRKEIEKHYGEIMEFSGIATFAATPLKYYSSGMRIRLAFSIAAFLQPEILLVDEVLAVGDIAFQQKCIAKMEEKASEGVTILFVSHDLEAVKRLCKRCIYIENGEINSAGNTNKILQQYLSYQALDQINRTEIKRTTSKPLYISKIILEKGQREYFNYEEIPIQIQLKNSEIIYGQNQIWMDIKDSSQKTIIQTGYDISDSLKLNSSYFDLHMNIPAHTLLPGKYTIKTGIWEINGWKEIDIAEEMLEFEVKHTLKIKQSNDDIPVIDGNWSVSNANINDN